MLNVVTPDNVYEIIEKQFKKCTGTESVPLCDAAGRILAEDICASEYIPDFDRSTVDGYAVRAEDTFGCCDSIPALLILDGEIRMGMPARMSLPPGHGVYVPTGGAVPEGADAMVMLEYCEDYGDGTIGIGKPAAPGNNMILRGDDVYPGKKVLFGGHRLQVPDIGALAAMGYSEVPVRKKPVAAVISTGDELVPVSAVPQTGQIRDVNTSLLAASLAGWGCKVIPFGIVQDEENVLCQTVKAALVQCDLVLISGGSSVGTKDATCRVIEGLGQILFHGIAMKPGKPTIFGVVDQKPVIGLPGHPAAAHFVSQLFVETVAARLMGAQIREHPVTAVLTENVSANHGRAQYMGVRLKESGDALYAEPVHGKSGLITSLAGTDGYFCIPRDCEGMKSGTEVRVYFYHSY